MPKHHIVDWTGKVKFNGQQFDTFDDGIAFLREYITKEHGELPDHELEILLGEYSVDEVEVEEEPQTLTREDHEMLLLLSGESTVMTELLIESPDLIKLVKAKKSKDECLAWINENF